jgi:hypothetical protein
MSNGSGLVARFGRVPTPNFANLWRTNDERIEIYRGQPA